MTREEFIHNSVALVGTSVGWQAKIARQLNVSDRYIRLIVAGDRPVNDGIAKDLLDLMGESAPQLIHAKWVLGDGSDGREYLIHTHHPRFQCLVIPDNESDYNLSADAGVQYGPDGYTLAGFIWLDHKPDNITQLMESVCDFIDDAE
jgi:hypothetical protein